MMTIKQLMGTALACAMAWSVTPASAMDTIETGLVGSPNSAEWEMYVGVHQGFFTEAGIKLDIIYVPTASGVMQQLSSGSLDIVDTSAPAPIDAVAHGAPVAIIRITEAVPPYDLVANDKVKTVNDLKGKTVVLGSLVNITHVYLERVLGKVGLKDSDVDIITVGNTEGRYAALTSHSADVAMLAPPFNFIAESSGFHNLGTLMEFAKDLPFGAADVSLDYAKKNHAVVVRFLRALDKSIAWFNTDANREAAIDILVNEMKTTKRDEVAQSYDYLRKIGFFPNDSTIHRKSLETLMKDMIAIGDTEGNVPIGKLVLPDLTRVED